MKLTKLQKEMVKTLTACGDRGLSVEGIALDIKHRGDMWGDKPPATPQNTISSYLTKDGRQLVADRLFEEMEHGIYRLNIPGRYTV